MNNLILFSILLTSQLPKQEHQKTPLPHQDVILDLLSETVDGLLGDKPRVENDEEKRQLKMLWGKMRGHVNRLKRSSRTSQMPDSYKQSVLDDDEVLRDIRQGKTQPEETLQLCQDIETDLSIKAEHPTGLVTVIAHTKVKETEEKSGFEVFYVAKGLAKKADRYQRFARFSSPTLQSLAPGNYVMWSQHGKACGAKTPVQIAGVDGRDKEDVDLDTPN